MTIDAGLDKIEKIVGAAAVEAVNATLTSLNAAAVKASSGPLKSKTLAKRDHPYAQRHGPFGKPGLQTRSIAGLDTSMMPIGGIINTQSGAFRSAWSVSRPRVTDSGGTVNGRLVNMDEKADLLKDGTRYMIPRPIEAGLTIIGRSMLEQELQKAARRLEDKHGK